MKREKKEDRKGKKKKRKTSVHKHSSGSQFMNTVHEQSS